ncbi:MAG: hypothetical protein SNG49_02570 [Rikenellaceae bacterium]
MKTSNNRGIYFLVLAATLFFFASCAPVRINTQKIDKKIQKVEVKQTKLDTKHKSLEAQKKQSISSNSNRR